MIRQRPQADHGRAGFGTRRPLHHGERTSHRLLGGVVLAAQFEDLAEVG
jgi:hypothetical protein